LIKKAAFLKAAFLMGIFLLTATIGLTAVNLCHGMGQTRDNYFQVFPHPPKKLPL